MDERRREKNILRSIFQDHREFSGGGGGRTAAREGSVSTPSHRTVKP